MAHGLSCIVSCGIFLEQASNPCLLHRQANSLPPSHQESPYNFTLKCNKSSLFKLYIVSLFPWTFFRLDAYLCKSSLIWNRGIGLGIRKPEWIMVGSFSSYASLGKPPDLSRLTFLICKLCSGNLTSCFGITLCR